MPIRGIAIDLEGTCVDVEEAHHQSHLATAAEFGLTITLEEAYTKLPHFIGGPDREICREIHELLDPATRVRTTISEIAARDKFHYNLILSTLEIKPRPGVVQFIEAVSGMDLKVAIGSLTPADQAHLLLEHSGLGTLIGEANIVLAEHVQKLKPAPDVYLKTAEIMGIWPVNQVVFGDSPNDMRAALAAGSQTVGMPVVWTGATVGALIDTGACRVFRDWREINVPALIENLGG